MLAPLNCNWLDYDANCLHSSPKTYVENTMVVLKSDGKSLEIACTVYNQWSHCTSLPVNQSFQAWLGKHGLEIRYLDQQGKVREQVYEILGRAGNKQGFEQGRDLEYRSGLTNRQVTLRKSG